MKPYKYHPPVETPKTSTRPHLGSELPKVKKPKVVDYNPHGLGPKKKEEPHSPPPDVKWHHEMGRADELITYMLEVVQNLPDHNVDK